MAALSTTSSCLWAVCTGHVAGISEKHLTIFIYFNFNLITTTRKGRVIVKRLVIIEKPFRCSQIIVSSYFLVCICNSWRGKMILLWDIFSVRVAYWLGVLLLTCKLRNGLSHVWYWGGNIIRLWVWWPFQKNFWAIRLETFRKWISQFITIWVESLRCWSYFFSFLYIAFKIYMICK